MLTPTKRSLTIDFVFRKFTNFKKEITKVFKDIDTIRTTKHIINNFKQTSIASKYTVSF